MAKRKTAGLFRRGEIWHYDKVYRGRRIRGSSGETDREIAEEVLAKRLSDVRMAEIYGVRPKRCFVEAATHYLKTKRKKSLAEDARHLRAVMPYIGASCVVCPVSPD